MKRSVDLATCRTIMENELVNGGWGVIPNVSGNNEIYTTRVNNASVVMGDIRKETCLNNSTPPITASLQSHYGLNEEHYQRRTISARYPRRADSHDIQYAWTGDNKYDSKTYRATITRSLGPFQKSCEIEAVRLYNMNPKNGWKQKRQGNIRPKTALCFRDRQYVDQSSSARPQSRNSYFKTRPATVNIDPNIPITGNWDGIKDLTEDKVYDLYRRYLGIEYMRPPRIHSSVKEEDDAADKIDERGDSVDNNDDHAIDNTTNGEFTMDNNAIVTRKISSDANVDCCPPEKGNQQHAENEHNPIKLAQSKEGKRRLEFPTSSRAVLSKLTKSVSKFRRGSKKTEPTTSENKSSIQLPQLGNRRHSLQPPTLKVKCSAEFQTAMMMDGLIIS